MKIALVTIATGLVYWDYAQEMVMSARQFMPPHDQFIFADRQFRASIMFDGTPGSWQIVPTKPMGYPEATLMRYRTILKIEETLRNYDQIFYSDADMAFVAPVGNIFNAGLTATLHPGYIGTPGTPESNRDSLAFCDWNKNYYAGGFQGGDSKAYIHAMHVMADRIDADAAKGITAVWHDESHWNRYLADHQFAEDLQVLTPSYCYPEDYAGGWGWAPEQFPPILVALDKIKRGNHPRYK